MVLSLFRENAKNAWEEGHLAENGNCYLLFLDTTLPAFALLLLTFHPSRS